MITTFIKLPKNQITTNNPILNVFNKLSNNMNYLKFYCAQKLGHFLISLNSFSKVKKEFKI